MWRGLIACFLLLVVVSPSSARHWHHHYRYYLPALLDHGAAAEQLPTGETAEFVPSGWTLQAPNPQWTGKRFVSPDGRACFAAYSSEVAQEPVPAHMRAIAFVDGETPTFIRGDSDRIAVAGTKGDRMFYRKAVIACGGRTWHHIAFEYPIDMTRYVDPMLQRAATAVDMSENDGCDAPVAKAPTSQSQPETTGTSPSR